MSKGLQKKAREYWSKLMNDFIPDYGSFNEESDCLFRNERVFCKQKDKVFLFVIFSPGQKYSNQLTIELGWSKKLRFPDLPVRPFIASREQIYDFDKYTEATFRLLRIDPAILLAEPLWDIVQVSEDDYREVLDGQMNILLKHGIPYLEKI